MNKETIKKLKTGIMKAAGIAVIGAGLVTFAACNHPGQTNTPVNPNPGGDKNPGTNPNPPVVNPIEKTVTVDKIYAENFSTTSFDADIQTAQKSLAGRVFDGQQPQITNINYDENLKELTFAISFVENNETKSGSMTFAAPTLFQQIRGKQAKAVVLEIAELSGSTEIKEANVDEVIDKLETIILNTKLQIASSFASIQKSDVKIERPVEEEKITIGEIFDQNFADLNFNAEIESALQTIYKNGYGNIEATTLFYSVDENSKTLNVYVNLKDKKNNLNEVKIPVPQIIIDLQKDIKSLILGKANLLATSEVEKDTKNNIISLLNNTLSDIREDISALGNVSIYDLQDKTFITSTNNLTNYKDFAEKLFPDKDIIYAGVSDLSIRMDDGKYFDTGYYKEFNILSVYKEGEVISLNTKNVFVPWYSSSTNESLYNSFLKENKYKIISDETITITDPIEVNRLDEYVSKTEKFAQYEITGLDAIAQSDEEEKRLYDNAYEALWLSM